MSFFITLSNTYPSKTTKGMSTRKKYTHVCIPANVYGLMDYLLYIDEETIKNHTHYFIGSEIPKEIAESLPNVTLFNTQKAGGIKLFIKQLKKIFLSIFSRIVYPELRTAKIYAQDHQPLAQILIQKRNYTLLPDSAYYKIILREGGLVKKILSEKQHSLKGKIEKFLYGELSINFWGLNNQCTEVLFIHDEKIKEYEGKKITVNTFNKLWQNSTPTKQRFIRQCFAIEDKDISDYSGADIVVLTQPFSDDGAITVAEQIDLYKNILEQYKEENIILKPHPRDKTDYSTLQRQYKCKIVKSHIPTELLALIGVNIKTAVTFFSSSVYIFNQYSKIIWLGTEDFPALKAQFGAMEAKIINPEKESYNNDFE